MKIPTSKSCHSVPTARAKLLAGLIIISGFLPAHGQQLADHFNDRLPVGGMVFSTLGTNTLASTDPGEQPNRSVNPVRTLWVRWTAPANGYALVTSSNSPSRTLVNVWDYHKVLNELQQIPGQNNSGLPTALDRFEFNAISAADYNLVVDGRDGDKGVVQLDLKLYTMPEILVQPADVTVTAGQRTNLSVTALGNFPLTNQWQHSPVPNLWGYTNLPGGVNPQLTLGTNGVVSKSDEGWYRVMINNEYGAVTSSVAYVEVNECATPKPPLPASVVTNVGKSVVFSASAFGSQPFSYQWQFKPSGQVGFVDVPDATSSDLVLDNVSTDDAGDYRFLVSNVACSDQVSTNVTLTVTTNNALVLDPTMPVDLTRITNQTASFSLRLTDGYQPISYQWWFSPPSGPTNAIGGESDTSLTLNSVRLDQAGTYWASASNRYAVVNTRHARLTVEIRPPNDNFVDRIPIFPQWQTLPTDAQSSATVYGWNNNGTVEPGEPRHQGLTTNYSVWWSFTAPADGQVIAELLSPNNPAQLLAAYTGATVNGLTPVVDRTNSLTRFEFFGLANTEYAFAVDSQSQSGSPSTNISLKLTYNPTYAPTILCQPGDACGGGDGGGIVGGGGADVDTIGDSGGAGEEGCTNFSGFSVVATSIDGAVYYQWQFCPTNDGTFVDLPSQTNSMLMLPSVTISNQGWYRAAVMNNAHAVVYTRAVHLNVINGPVIAANGQPGDVVTNACTSAQFKVTALSCSPLGYQWRHNGMNVTEPNAVGTNTNTLVITNLAPDNEGFYDVIVWNAHQSLTSAVVRLTLTNTPVLVTQPHSATNFACETVSFLVGAAANCPLTYQWLLHGGPLAGATTTSLNLSNVQPSDAGDYSVVASTPFGSVTSQVARLTIRTDPVITQQPAISGAVHPCDVVNLQVQVQAEPVCSPVFYQWQHAGTNLPPDTHPGATNRTFSFDAVAEAAGDYRVIVSNPWASVTSSVARVTFDARPVLSTQPAAYQRLREGDAFTNQVAVACPSLSLNYVWQLRQPGGTIYTDVALDSRHVLTTNGWLIVRNAQTNETGYYRVLVSNVYSNTISSDGLVRVVRPPPNDYFTNATSLGASSPASATGYNEFATWELGEKPHALQGPSHSVWWVWTNPYPSIVTVDLGGSDIDTVLSVYTGTTLSNLNSVAEDDDGRPDKRSRVSFMAGGGKALYLAVDGKNQAEGTNLVVSVTAAPLPPLAPVIPNQPLNLAASPGDTATFSLLAYGSPDITIQWYGKGAPVQGTTQIIGLTNYQSTLTLNNVTTNDQGVYRAVLINSYGSVTSAIAVLTFGSIVRGMVSDATKAGTNGLEVGIPGALVSVGDVSAVTDTNGNYELVGVQIGDVRADFMANKTHVHLNENVQFWNLSTATAAQLTATKDGYYDYVDDHFEVGKGQTVAKWFSMSPIFSGLRFVLNWTNKPGDLDLYLQFPTNAPVPYPRIDYLPTTQGSTSAPPFAIRDVDARNGWGPETITIVSFYPGTYNVYGRKYPGEAGYFLAQSSAQVVAYLGGDVTNGFSPELKSIGSVSVPTVGTNDWWHVCDFDGETTNITWINQLLPTAPWAETNHVLALPLPPVVDPKPYPQPKDRFTTNADYEWTFGDGSPVSTQPEPWHAYADPGWKTISLKMTLRTGSPLKTVSVTKTNYIYVENLPPIVAITNPLPGTIFRAGDPVTLQSSADGVDDAIQQVAYYQVVSGQTNYLGTATNTPYTLLLPNTNYVDATNVFLALARDVHGATGWSEPLAVRIIDLRGDILIIRNFPSAEIDEMVDDLGELLIPDRGAPIVKVLDQEGLYFGLVQDFKAIIWNDQGTTEGGLTDNDVGVLRQAYDAGIPLYLIGGRLAESAIPLADFSRYQQWIELLGSQRLGSISPPMHVHGIPIPDYKDGLYYGWYDQAGTDILINNALEQLSLVVTNMDVVADVPVVGSLTNSPIMLRYPQYSQPDFGETRRLIQDFRVTSDQPPQSSDEADSREDRRIQFINGVAWLLRMFECQAINVTLECQDPGSGVVGQSMTFAAVIAQNGACTSGGVLVTNYLSPRLQAISATLTPLEMEAPTNNYQLIVASNLTVVRFSGIPRVSYLLETLAVPRLGGWVTNVYTVVRGLNQGDTCSQVCFIQGPGCEAVQLGASFGTNQLLRLAVRGGVGCAFMLQSSADLVSWVDSIEIQPDADPYEVPIAPSSNTVRFYRLRKEQ